ncbi:MAG: alpha/beta fold hydrolase [Porticoccaceae bacterium]
MKAWINCFALFVLFSSSIAYSHSMEKIKHTYVLVHGMTGGGWDWKLIDNLLSEDGHEVYRPTLTGLGERMHLEHPDINLSTHILDIVNLIKFEQLENIILVGHSYGGMVITGVMNELPEKIQYAFFLDALVPDHGMSAMDVAGKYINFPTKNGLAYPPWLDNKQIFPRDLPHPVKTLTEKVVFNNKVAKKLPATYINFTPQSLIKRERSINSSWKRAEKRGWVVKTLDSDHNAHRSNPEALKKLLTTF